MKTAFVDVKEVWSHTVRVEVPDDATKEDILEAANQVVEFEANDPTITEYDWTLDPNMWTVRVGDDYL
jgi:hypothetical protein